MLFLTMGAMRHEALWSLWFKDARLLAPKDCMSAALCQQDAAQAALENFTSCLSNRSEQCPLEQPARSFHASLTHEKRIEKAQNPFVLWRNGATESCACHETASQTSRLTFGKGALPKSKPKSGLTGPNGAGGVMQQQVLFSLYVHPPPGFEGYGEDSLFYKTEIVDRVNSSWGTFDLAQASLLTQMKDATCTLFNGPLEMLCWNHRSKTHKLKQRSHAQTYTSTCISSQYVAQGLRLLAMASVGMVTGGSKSDESSFGGPAQPQVHHCVRVLHPPVYPQHRLPPADVRREEPHQCVHHERELGKG